MKVGWGIGGTLSERPSLYYLFTHQPEADRLLKQRYFNNQFQQFCDTSVRNQGWKWKWKEREKERPKLGNWWSFSFGFLSVLLPWKGEKKTWLTPIPLIRCVSPSCQFWLIVKRKSSGFKSAEWDCSKRLAINDWKPQHQTDNTGKTFWSCI